MVSFNGVLFSSIIHDILVAVSFIINLHHVYFIWIKQNELWFNILKLFWCFGISVGILKIIQFRYELLHVLC